MSQPTNGQVSTEAAHAKTNQVLREYASEVAERRVRELLLLDEVQRLIGEVSSLQREVAQHQEQVAQLTDALDDAHGQIRDLHDLLDDHELDT